MTPSPAAPRKLGAMGRPRFLTAVAAFLSVAALLAGCSESPDGEPAAETSATGTPGATGDAPDAGVVTWADGVCSATTDLEAAVQQVTAALQVDPAASDTALDQAKAQVAERVGAVRVAVDDVRSAISTSPPGVVNEQLTAAGQQLSATADRARTAADQLQAQGQALADAQTPAETASALAAAGAALAAARAGIQAHVAALRDTAQSRDPVIRDAFAAAPACEARGATPSP
jgi:hypothetical protein